MTTRQPESFMTHPSLHPDAVAAKYTTLKHWRDCATGRPEKLGNWQTVVGGDGRLHISAQLNGPNPAQALRAFMNRQAAFLSLRAAPGEDDQMPYLDLSVPGRTAAVWRLDGVWVEVWYPDAEITPQPPAQPAAVPSRRGLGARLPYTRRQKENTRA